MEFFSVVIKSTKKRTIFYRIPSNVVKIKNFVTALISFLFELVPGKLRN